MKNTSSGRWPFVHTALLAALVALLGLLAPRSVAAQDDLPCPCGQVTVAVDKNVACKVTICVVLGGKIRCATVEPGASATFACLAGATFNIRDCHGVLVPFDPFAGDCVRGIGAGPNCCTVDICTVNDACPAQVLITPSILDVCPCL